MDFGERLFRGSWSVGPFHCYPFTLTKRGSHTLLHAHEHDHLVSANKPIAVYAMTTDGEGQLVPVGLGDRRLIIARTEHLIVALEDDTECECLFSRYDESGAFLDDPKETCARQPYRERCHERNLPALVFEYLARDHGVASNPV